MLQGPDLKQWLGGSRYPWQSKEPWTLSYDGGISLFLEQLPGGFRWSQWSREQGPSAHDSGLLLFLPGLHLRGQQLAQGRDDLREVWSGLGVLSPAALHELDVVFVAWEGLGGLRLNRRDLWSG